MSILYAGDAVPIPTLPANVASPVTVVLPVNVGLVTIPICTWLFVTAVSISFAVPIKDNVSLVLTKSVLEPSDIVNDVDIDAVPAAVNLPCASTVNVGIAVALPYDPAVTEVLAKLNVLLAVISPPPDKPVPAVNVTALWSICSLATNPLKLSWTISLSLVDIVSALTVIPVPSPTFIVLVVAIVPPPVKPLPAIIDTAVWSICSLATKLVIASWSTLIVIVLPLPAVDTPLPPVIVKVSESKSIFNAPPESPWKSKSCAVICEST